MYFFRNPPYRQPEENRNEGQKDIGGKGGGNGRVAGEAAAGAPPPSSQFYALCWW